MKRRHVLTALVGLFGLVGCADPESEPGDPGEIPPGYPQLGPVETGRAELTVNGESFVAGNGLGTVARGGIEQLAAHMSFGYALQISIADVELGEYSSDADEVEASWNEVGLPAMSIEEDCGRGRVFVDGATVHELFGLPVIWGTLQLELCDDEGTVWEVSGRYTVAVPGV